MVALFFHLARAIPFDERDDLPVRMVGMITVIYDGIREKVISPSPACAPLHTPPLPHKIFPETHTSIKLDSLLP